MTAPTPLSASELAAIAEWLDPRQVYMPTSEGRKLFASHAALAERLAESDREKDELVYTHKRDTQVIGELRSAWNKEIESKVAMRHERDDAIQVREDLRAQLAASEATVARSQDAFQLLQSNYDHVLDDLGEARDQAAMDSAGVESITRQWEAERDRRIAAEARAAKFRAALVAIANVGTITPVRECQVIARAALPAAPSLGAGAVLTAAEKWLDARQAVNLYARSSVEDREALMDDYVQRQLELEEKTSAWRGEGAASGG
jgi:hypothetical protein